MNWEESVVWLRNQPDQHDLVRDCFFDDPLIEAANRYHASREWLAMRGYLPHAAGSALDIGAGRGIASFALAKEGWRVTALEPDPSAIVGAEAIRSLARDSGLSIQVIQERGERLPFANASYDLVLCRQSLHHAQDLQQLCREIGRVLRPGGRLIATREHVISRKEDLPTFLKSHPLHHLYGGENAYLLDEYIKALAGADIRIDKVLNPLESEINLYPETMTSIKRRLARRLRVVAPSMIPDIALKWAGRRMTSPGRLYSFVGTKPS